jgi:hypothetical protein
MFIMTHRRLLLAVDAHTGLLQEAKELPAPGSGITLLEIPDSEVLRLDTARGMINGRSEFAADGPLAGCEYIKSNDFSETFSILKDNLYACADGSDSIVFDRKLAGPWEMFCFIPSDAGARSLTEIQQEDAFTERVAALTASGQPVCLHFGCGNRRIDGFLNIDKYKHLGYAENYYLFDFTGQPWPIADASVDYIYSEDFIEHVPQKTQLAFLAEAFRVLKKGAYNRVSVPCLYESMKAHSDFSKGFAGFYFGEYEKQGHVALFTRGSLQEVALMIGYRCVFFTAKGHGTSPYAVTDVRPGSDRDPELGNIFADLLK